MIYFKPLITFAAGFPLSVLFDLEVQPTLLLLSLLDTGFDGSGAPSAALATIRCTGAEQSVHECVLSEIDLEDFDDLAAIRCIGETMMIG